MEVVVEPRRLVEQPQVQVVGLPLPNVALPAQHLDDGRQHLSETSLELDKALEGDVALDYRDEYLLVAQETRMVLGDLGPGTCELGVGQRRISERSGKVVDPCPALG